MITQEVRKELDAWLRPFSPIVAFAKSLRMEGASQEADASKAKEDAQKTVDHFEGIDLDDLPENVRTAVTNAKATLTTLQTTATAAETRRAQAEGFARQKQSEADKFRGVLQRHNLDPNDPPKQGNLSGDKHKALVEKFTADGLKPELAETYAKMFASASEIERASLIQELGPLAGAVGGIQATQALAAAEGKHADLFKIDEVAKNVRDNVAVMVTQGNTVNAATIDHLLEMAYGGYLMRNPDALKTQTTQQQQVPKLGGGGGMGTGGAHFSATEKSGDGAPPTTQPETTSIVNALNAEMRRGLPAKKGGK